MTSTDVTGPAADPAEVPATKVVLVIRHGTVVNRAVNAAAVLSATIGSRLALPLGAAASDASGTTFPGIITTPIPILAADAAELARLFTSASGESALHVSALTEVARSARTYEAYVSDLAQTSDASSDLVALGIAGPRNRVTKLTKKLPLLGAGG